MSPPIPSSQGELHPVAAEAPVGLQHFVPPTARELRAQAVQRLQVGLFGLAAMLLLVGLANIIMQHARSADAAAAASAKVASSGGAGNGDPLADIGVVPDAGANAKHGAAGHASPVH